MLNRRAKHQQYKGRVVLRGDSVKDDSGSYAVFTEQGSSASQMTAAKIMDIISRLPGCDGQAADAVSAFTQVKMEDAHKLLKIPKSEVSRHFDTSTTTQMAKIMVQYGTNQSFLLNEICMVIHSQDYCGKGNSRKLCWSTDGKKVPHWERFFVNRQKRLLLSVYVDDIKLAGKKENIDPMCMGVDETR